MKRLFARAILVATTFLLPSAAWSQVGSGPPLEDIFRLAVAPSGELIAYSHSLQALISVDPATGDRTIVADNSGVGTGPPIHFSPLVVEATGDILTTSGFSVVRVDRPTGNRTVISSHLGPGVGPNISSAVDMALEADGNLLISDWSNDALFRVDTTNGDRTILVQPLIAGPGSSVPNYSIAIDDADHVFVGDRQNQQIIRVNLSTGSGTVVSDNAGAGSGPPLMPWSIVVDSNGDLLVANTQPFVGTDAILSVDPLTGDRTVLSSAIEPSPELVGRGPGLALVSEIALEANGEIVAADEAYNAIRRIDPQSGDRSTVSGVGCPPVVAPDCIAADVAKLKIDDRKSGKEKLRAVWKKFDEFTTQVDISDPESIDNMGVSVCLYDDSGLIAQAYTAGGRAAAYTTCEGCWQPKGTAGFIFKFDPSIGDIAGTYDGIKKIRYTSGEAGSGKLTLSGKNDSFFTLPTGSVPILTGNSTPTLQFITTTNFCIGAQATKVRASEQRFSAKTP